MEFSDILMTDIG